MARKGVYMESLPRIRSGIPENPIVHVRRFSLLASIFLIITSAVSIYANGRITILDSFFLLLAFLSIPLSLKNPFLRPILVAAIFISLVQNLSDLVNGTKFFSITGFFGYQIVILTAGLYWLYKEKRVGLGTIVISTCLGISILQFNYGILNYSNLWKYNFSFAITMSCFVLANIFSKSLVLHFFLGIFMSFINYVNDFRAGLFASLVYAFLSIRLKYRFKSDQNSKSTKKYLLKLVSQSLLLVVLFFAIYPVLATNGYLGDRAQRQQISFESANVGNRFIFAIRPELPYIFFLSLQAPVLGFGSYGSPSGTQIDKALENLSGLVPVSEINFRKWLLASDLKTNGYNLHSRLGSTLIAGGWLTMFFWFRFFAQYSRVWFHSWWNSLMKSNLLGYALVFVFWDSLFSPPTHTSRFEIALLLLIGAIASENRKTNLT